MPGRTVRRTTIVEALIFLAGLLEDGTLTSPRHLIDVFGEGPNNLVCGLVEASYCAPDQPLAGPKACGTWCLSVSLVGAWLIFSSAGT